MACTCMCIYVCLFVCVCLCVCVCVCVCVLACMSVKGLVCWYWYDVKPFNLTACVITKCDVNVVIMRIKMAGHGKQYTIMYKL